MNPTVVILIALGVAALIFLIVKAAKAHAERERQRKAALAHWASVNGFQYSDVDPWNLDARYGGISDIGRGHSRYALEVLTRTDPVPVTIFRYHYKTWETRTVRDSNGNSRTETYEETHWRRFLIAELGGSFPPMSIRLEGLFDKIVGLVGFDDINFESEAFSRRYHIKSPDKQFAYAVMHPQMMEWLLPLSFQAQLDRGLLIMDINAQKHTAETCQEAWALASGFVNRIPQFVWQDYGKRPPLSLPEPTAYLPPAPVVAQGT